MDQYQKSFEAYVSYLQTDWLLLGGGIVAITLWIFSGCMAASIAENRLRNPVVHFIIGMILPVIYPALIQFTLPVYLPKSKKKVEEHEELFEKVAGAPPPEGGGKSVEDLEIVDVDMLATAPTSQMGSGSSLTGHNRFDAAYFRKIARDETGSARGPFLITVEGNEVRVEHILDPKDDVVIVERVGSDGKNTKLRIPYGKIENCVEI